MAVTVRSVTTWCKLRYLRSFQAQSQWCCPVHHRERAKGEPTSTNRMHILGSIQVHPKSCLEYEVQSEQYPSIGEGKTVLGNLTHVISITDPKVDGSWIKPIPNLGSPRLSNPRRTSIIHDNVRFIKDNTCGATYHPASRIGFLHVTRLKHGRHLRKFTIGQLLGHYPQKYEYSSVGGKLKQAFMKTQLVHYSTVSYLNNCSPILNNASSTQKPAEQVRFVHKITPDMAEPVTDNIHEVLSRYSLHIDKGHVCYVIMCPVAGRRGRKPEKPDDRLFVNTLTGFFVCQKCGKNGSWSMLKENLDILETRTQAKRTLANIDCFDGVDPAPGESVLRDLSIQHYQETPPVSQLPPETLDGLLDVLGMRALKAKTMEKFGVRAQPDGKSLVFVYHGLNDDITGLRWTTVKEVEKNGAVSNKILNRYIPKLHCCTGIFKSKKQNQSKELVITGSEADAMAVEQETNYSAICLPRGHTILPQVVLPMLEGYDWLILWLGSDVRSWEAARQWASKLGQTRCSVIRPSDQTPAPLQALQAGIKLSPILKQAKPVIHKSIVSFRDIRSDVFAEVAQAEQVKGVKWKRFTSLNNLLKGHRRGELTIFTGPTGSGKTTFISEYSLDLCMQGVNTLWGSFEISNVRLVRTMLSQFAQVNLTKNLDQYDQWADQFESLPMYFMTFHGQEQIRNVIETMAHAVYVHDIAHVIVDNLQFMMGVDCFNASDRFLKQDQLIASFRKFSTKHNCHVTLVIHPRKEQTDSLTVNSIFGGAKASQEADNILILQDKRLLTPRGRKYIEVAKNRYEGERGIVPLKFDRDSFSFTVKSKKEKAAETEVERLTQTDNIE